MKFSALLIIFLSVSLAACSSRYMTQAGDRFVKAVEFKAHHQLKRSRNIALSPLNHVCVAAQPLENVEFREQLAKDLFTALQIHFVTVSTLINVESPKGALTAAYKQRCGMLFYLSIINRQDRIWSMAEWDQPQTGWTDVGTDKLQLDIVLWDVNSSVVLDSAIITSRSAWLDLYSSNSADLIRGALDLYLQQLVALR